MTTRKVFGIGFHKTGTTSLARALAMLGYRVTGPNYARHPDVRDAIRAEVWRLVDEYDAFQDNPWPLLYPELDRRYPGSRFVLTLRPTADWIASVVAHFGGTRTPMREWIYGDGLGDPRGNEAAYTARYERHNREVLAHFAGRPEALLVLRVTEGEGWEKLCPFLGAAVPGEPFPHANAAEDRGLLRAGAARLGRRGRRVLGRAAAPASTTPSRIRAPRPGGRHAGPPSA
jgi:hypothetical protein